MKKDLKKARDEAAALLRAEKSRTKELASPTAQRGSIVEDDEVFLDKSGNLRTS